MLQWSCEAEETGSDLPQTEFQGDPSVVLSNRHSQDTLVDQSFYNPKRSNSAGRPPVLGGGVGCAGVTPLASAI